MHASLTMPPVHSGLSQERNVLHMPAHNALERPSAAASVESLDLLRGQKTVEIRHNGAVYRLQATKLGKLILTK